MAEDYAHPASGRIYREGDPAHRFARLAAALRRQCEDFIHYYDRDIAHLDYLDQQRAWPSDPDRIARNMVRTIAQIDEAYTAVTTDRDLYRYGLGNRDAEWHRKYGHVDDCEGAISDD